MIIYDFTILFSPGFIKLLEKLPKENCRIERILEVSWGSLCSVNPNLYTQTLGLHEFRTDIKLSQLFRALPIHSPLFSVLGKECLLYGEWKVGAGKHQKKTERAWDIKKKVYMVDMFHWRKASPLQKSHFPLLPYLLGWFEVGNLLGVPHHSSSFHVPLNLPWLGPPSCHRTPLNCVAWKSSIMYWSMQSDEIDICLVEFQLGKEIAFGSCFIYKVNSSLIFAVVLHTPIYCKFIFFPETSSTLASRVLKSKCWKFFYLKSHTNMINILSNSPRMWWLSEKWQLQVSILTKLFERNSLSIERYCMTRENAF